MTFLYRIRKRLYWIIGVLLLVVGIYVGWRLVVTRGYRSAAGIYIVGSGRTYLSIEPKGLGSLSIKQGMVPTYGGRCLSDAFLQRSLYPTLHASFKYGRLIITQQLEKDIRPSGYWKESLTLTLIPSKTRQGDWDLVEAELKIKSGKSKNILVLCSDIVQGNAGMDSVFDKLQNLIGKNEFGQFVLDPKKSPLPSYLHNIDDNRIPVFYESLFQEEYGHEPLNIARSLSKTFPHDPFIRLLRVELEAQCGVPETALDLRKKWEKEFQNYPNPLLQLGKRIVWRNVANAQFRKRNHLNLNSAKRLFEVTQKSKSQRSTDWKIKTIKDFYLSEGEPYYYTAVPFVQVTKNVDDASLRFPDFLEMQVHAKVSHILSKLYLFEGRFGVSLEVAASAYRLGQSLNSAGNLISRIIGIAIRNVAVGALEVCVLNTCQAPEDFRAAWSLLEHLYHTPYMESGEHLQEGEHPVLFSMMKPVSDTTTNYAVHYRETLTRHRVSNTKFQLTRVAIAAKYRYVTTGSFPSAGKEFAPLLPDGIPTDVFSDAPLRYRLCHDQDAFMVYSVRPNSKDEYGKLTYNPTNGTISPGDIITRVPRKRTYPFPLEGVRADTAYELLEQFPNGLPRDIFANTHKRPLSILESTEEHPLTVFSFGANTDEDEYTPMDSEGLTHGDFVIKPVPTSSPPPSAPYSRGLQLVMRRAETFPIKSQPSHTSPETQNDPLSQYRYSRRHPPPGHWYLESMYDPTNGTISPGDLYLEIPPSSGD